MEKKATKCWGENLTCWWAAGADRRRRRRNQKRRQCYVLTFKEEVDIEEEDFLSQR